VVLAPALLSRAPEAERRRCTRPRIEHRSPSVGHGRVFGKMEVVAASLRHLANPAVRVDSRTWR